MNHLDVFEVIAVGWILSGGRISRAARKILTQRRATEQSSSEGGGLRVVRLGMLHAGYLTFIIFETLFIIFVIARM